MSAQPITLLEEEVRERFALFDPHNRFAALFEELRPLIDREADRVAAVFWRSMRRNPTVAAAVTDAELPQILRDTAKGFRSQFVMARDAAWCERISRHGDMCYDLKVPGRQAVAAIVDAYDHLIAVLVAERPPRGRDHAIIAFSRMAALEHELVLTRINDRHKQAERERVAALGEAFRAKVVGGVDQAVELSRTVGEQSRTASTNSRMLVDRSQQVMSAAQQCAQAMTQAARESGAMLDRMASASADVEHSAAVARDAAAQSEANCRTAAVLREATASIDSFTALINDIAHRTNLLALNATIEAARVGNVGAGFAVVAKEVKALATNAAEASEQVAGEMVEMRDAVSQSVTGNETIGVTIQDVRDKAELVQHSITLQRDALASISASIDETSLTVDNVSTVIATIFEAAQATEREMELAGATLGTVRDRLAALQADALSFLNEIRVDHRA